MPPSSEVGGVGVGAVGGVVSFSIGTPIVLLPLSPGCVVADESLLSPPDDPHAARRRDMASMDVVRVVSGVSSLTRSETNRVKS